MDIKYLCILIISTSVSLVNAIGDGAVFDPNVHQLQDRPHLKDLKNVKKTSGRAAKRRCGSTYQTVSETPIKIVLGQRDCAWDFLGTKTCTSEIACSDINLKNCDNDYLLITDGLGGEQKICGDITNINKGLKASKDGRDLYIVLKGKTGSIKCEVTCGGKGESLKIAPNSEKKEENHCICGMVPGGGNRIVGGETAKKFEFPWQAAIVFAGTRQPTCGGSIINDRYILTASHCFWFTKTEPDEIEVLIHAYQLEPTLQDGWKNVKLGEKGSIQGPGWQLGNVTDEDEGTQRIKVAEIITHPLFSDSYDFDVALLKLATKIDLKSNPEICPICIPPPGVFSEHNGQKLMVIGWGLAHQDAGATTKPLQKLEVPVINLAVCEKMMDMKLTSRMICAGFKEGVKDACLGDSGGPLFERPPKTGGKHTQVGIVSWGEGCAKKDRPGVYTNLHEVIQWVYSKTQDATWCRTTI